MQYYFDVSAFSGRYIFQQKNQNKFENSTKRTSYICTKF